ncbi:spermidine synthase [Solimonas sp. SE-A11]|uniref:spermidine synthase n=1 Tax=Solimonas sp. SE-A11 TaxID=3054954 RepID=UPI00259D0C53|nr:fused MFS/spermidine synthase [Solimonas sp. SE-A11]MDM4772443.1 fused MFS/spermidine synthase [Solimonas sp. SE-A11]
MPTLLFACTLFLSSALLFAVQPMISKMVLPLLGGSPGVWNACMCFFQAGLLAGYAYAHLLAKRLAWTTQAALHASLLLLAFLFLPPALGHAAPPADGSPVWWLLGLLAFSVGLPFFVLSATAPLVQHWFSRTRHPDARNPYFLYAASNAGSLLALLGYPLVIEPQWDLGQQGLAWSAGFMLLGLALAACFAAAYRQRSDDNGAPATEAEAPAVSGRLRLQWLALSFLPSSLLLGVTTFITTDLASTPLLWVIPLALYLTTFILVFARRPPLPHEWTRRALPHLLILIALLSLLHIASVWLLALHLAGFFVITMVSHGELAARRPPPAHLTEFYLYMSLGGVLGGIFNALLAPAIFSGVYEYPLMLAASCLLAGQATAGRRALALDGLLPALLLGALVLLALGSDALRSLLAKGGQAGIVLAVLAFAGLAALLLSFSSRPLRFALGIAACLGFAMVRQVQGALEMERSFFGIYKVIPVEEGRRTALLHGTTVHGVASRDPAHYRLPMSYYAPQGPFGQLLSADAAGGLARIGVVGLGVGALSCYARPGQAWTFHEIDPLVERLARDTRHFRYLEACGQNTSVVIGDARLTLEQVPDGGYDLLVLDAYSSDSIPLHLMSREALALYLRKLSPQGLLAFHVTNRHLDLMPVLARLAGDAGLAGLQQRFRPADELRRQGDASATDVVLLSRDPANLALLLPGGAWQPLEGVPGTPLWTDSYSNILGVIRWR